MTLSLLHARNVSPFVAGGLSRALVLSGCGSGPGESESKMTSFTASESKADTAELFSVPKEQMAHVQVVAVQKGPLARKLRLSGAVAYNAFETTPVFAAIGGPIREILVAPAGQPLLTVTSPDYSAARSAYIKGSMPSHLRTNSIPAPKIFTRTVRSLKPICSKPSPTALRRTPMWNRQPMPCAPSA